MLSSHVDPLIRPSVLVFLRGPSRGDFNNTARRGISVTLSHAGRSLQRPTQAQKLSCVNDATSCVLQGRSFSVTRPRGLAERKTPNEQDCGVDGVLKSEPVTGDGSQPSRTKQRAIPSQWRPFARTEKSQDGQAPPQPHGGVSLQASNNSVTASNEENIGERKKLRSTIRREEATKDELERELLFVAHNRPRVLEVHTILRVLIEQFAVKPDAIHYEAVILANCDPENGSLDEVKSLLAEMEREELPVGAGIYYAVLKVLAIHPDHLFRREILSLMQQQWATPSAAAYHHIVAGLIHDGQLELAMSQINQLRTQHQPLHLDPWLYVTLLHALCAATDLPAVQQLLYLLDDHRIEVSPLTWLLVLEAASSHHDLDLVRYVWARQVEPLYVNPPDGVCWDVLLGASRAGDVALAEKVVEVMARREKGGEAGLDQLVWEMLGEAYENARDVEGGERVRLRKEIALQRVEPRGEMGSDLEQTSSELNPAVSVSSAEDVTQDRQEQ